MSSIQGNSDPIRKLEPARVQGAHATEVLKALRDADFAETTVVPAVPPPGRPWFREDALGTPWSPSAELVPVYRPERRTERTGRLRIPEQYALDALQQELGMKARDLIAGHGQESEVLGHLQEYVWSGIKTGYGALKAAFEGVCAEERELSGFAEDARPYRELLDELDAFGLEKGFAGAVARDLGKNITRHRVTPWGALTVLKEHASPLDWSPPPPLV